MCLKCRMSAKMEWNLEKIWKGAERMNGICSVQPSCSQNNVSVNLKQNPNLAGLLKYGTPEETCQSHPKLYNILLPVHTGAPALCLPAPDPAQGQMTFPVLACGLSFACTALRSWKRH